MYVIFREWNKGELYLRDDGYIASLKVHPEYQRQGIGSALLLNAIAYAEAFNMPLWLAPLSPDGRDDLLVQWYFRFGFVWDEREEFLIYA